MKWKRAGTINYIERLEKSGRQREATGGDDLCNILSDRSRAPPIRGDAAINLLDSGARCMAQRHPFTKDATSVAFNGVDSTLVETKYQQVETGITILIWKLEKNSEVICTFPWLKGTPRQQHDEPYLTRRLLYPSMGIVSERVSGGKASYHGRYPFPQLYLQAGFLQPCE